MKGDSAGVVLEARVVVRVVGDESRAGIEEGD